MRKAVQLLACLLFAGGVSGALGAESFGFWPGKGVTKAPGFERMSEHPCGEAAYAKVSKLPTKADGPLISEVAVELDRRGKVIGRWPMPVDYTPHALRGAELLVTAGDGGFWIRPNGSFTRATALPASEATQVDCNLKHVFGESVYAGCSVFVDVASGKKRTLGYQGVCT